MNDPTHDLYMEALLQVLRPELFAGEEIFPRSSRDFFDQAIHRDLRSGELAAALRKDLGTRWPQNGDPQATALRMLEEIRSSEELWSRVDQLLDSCTRWCRETPLS